MSKYFFFVILFLNNSVWAETPKNQTETTLPAKSQILDPILYGLYIEGQMGGGYMVLNRELPAFEDPALAGISGSEGYGSGAQVSLKLGYDITGALAIQLVGGSSLISGRRRDVVRDLRMSFVGLGPRIQIGMSQRFDLALSAGPAYIQTSNRVEADTTSTGGFGQMAGVYHVHVLHFAVGVELAVLVPLDPMRLFVTLGPTVRYTF